MNATLLDADRRPAEVLVAGDVQAVSLSIVEDGLSAGGFLGVVVGIEGHESIEAVAEDGLGSGLEVGTVTDQGDVFLLLGLIAGKEDQAG